MWKISTKRGNEEFIFFKSQKNQDPILDFILVSAEKNKLTAILTGGAVGGGKSKTMAAAVILFAMKYPGCKVLVGRKDTNDLRSTLYLDIIKMLPEPIVRSPKSFAENLSLAPLILLNNGSQIAFSEMKDVGSSGKFGLEISMVVLDEVNEISEELYLTLQTRLRPWIGGPQNTPYIFLCACNPCPGWVKKTFVTNSLLPEETRDKSRMFFPLYPKDNTGLLKAFPTFISDMASRFPPTWVKRYLDGDWDISVTGAIYPEFDQKIHVVNDFKIPATWDLWHCLDPALGKPHKGLYAAQVPNGGPTFFYRSLTGLKGESTRDFLLRMIATERHDRLLERTEINAIRAGKDISPIQGSKDDYNRLIDYSLAGSLHEKNAGLSMWDILAELGIEYKKAHKISLFESIAMVKEGLQPRGGEKPLIYIFRSCVDLIEEITNYRFAPHSEGHDYNDKPIKDADDLVDNMRYIWIEKPWLRDREREEYAPKSPFFKKMDRIPDINDERKKRKTIGVNYFART